MSMVASNLGDHRAEIGTEEPSQGANPFCTGYFNCNALLFGMNVSAVIQRPQLFESGQVRIWAKGLQKAKASQATTRRMPCGTKAKL